MANRVGTPFESVLKMQFVNSVQKERQQTFREFLLYLNVAHKLDDKTPHGCLRENGRNDELCALLQTE